MEVVTDDKDSDVKSYVDNNTSVNDITKLKMNIKPIDSDINDKKITEDETDTKDSKIDDKDHQSQKQLVEQSKNIFEDDTNHKPTESDSNEITLLMDKEYEDTREHGDTTALNIWK